MRALTVQSIRAYNPSSASSIASRTSLARSRLSATLPPGSATPPSRPSTTEYKTCVSPRPVFRVLSRTRPVDRPVSPRVPARPSHAGHPRAVRLLPGSLGQPHPYRLRQRHGAQLPLLAVSRPCIPPVRFAHPLTAPARQDLPRAPRRGEGERPRRARREGLLAVSALRLSPAVDKRPRSQIRAGHADAAVHVLARARGLARRLGPRRLPFPAVSVRLGAASRCVRRVRLSCHRRCSGR